MKQSEFLTHIESVVDQSEIIHAMEELLDDFFSRNVDIEELSKKISQYGYFKVAYIDDDVAGFIGYYANDEESGVAFITTLVLAQQFHRRGIGTLLLQECLTDCRNKGMSFCKLEVDKKNTNAILFYKQFGFEKEAEATATSDYYICKL